MSTNNHETMELSSQEVGSRQPVHEDESGALKSHEEQEYSGSETVYEKGSEPFVVDSNGGRKCGIDQLVAQIKREQDSITRQ